MTTIIVLFNLKSDASKSAYETWAKETDLKTVRALNSIDRFDVFESMGCLLYTSPSPRDQRGSRMPSSA